MTPSTIGHARTDKIRILGMADAAYDLARNLLAPDGAFVCKLFQGGAHAPLLNVLKRDFARVRHAKPPASRKDRSEEHTSELQSLMSISYAVFCLKKKHNKINTNTTQKKATTSITDI